MTVGFIGEENHRPSASHWQTPGYNGYANWLLLMAGTWFKGIFTTKRHHLSFVEETWFGWIVWTSTGTSVGDSYVNKWIWAVTCNTFFSQLCVSFLSRKCKKKKLDIAHVHIFHTLPSIQFTLWNTAPILWMLGSIHITVKDVFTITPSVTNQTGSCGACSLRQSMWSMHKNFAGMEMTRKYRIVLVRSSK